MMKDTEMADRVAQLKALLEAEPNDAFCLYGLAMEHARRGDHHEALTWFDRAIEADPASAYSFFHKAKSQEAMGDITGAQATLRAGLESAKAARDAKAVGEIADYLESLL